VQYVVNGDAIMEKKEPIDKKSKADRVLRMYDLLMRGKVINKAAAGQKFGVDEKTIQRDLDDMQKAWM
jgi:predicted DNA-binding transcriptional regulator YafY